MKKYIALILTLTIICSCFATVSALASASSEELIECQTESEFLKFLGVLDETYGDNLSTAVTRGDFAKMLAKLLKKQGLAEQNTYFYDSENIPEINILAAAGIFKGSPDGFFYPERNITNAEATVALVRALGYETYVSARGGSVSQYALMAKKLDILSVSELQDELSVSDMIVAFYNALLADVYEIEAVSNSGVKYTAGGTNLLWTLYDMICVEGIVTADRFTGLYGSSSLGTDQIAINNKIYNTSLKTPWDYIGQNVKAFVKVKDDVETVSFIIADEELNETIVLEAGDFTYKNQVIEYENEKGKIRTITLADTMAVIKNHQAVTGDYDKAFDIKLGSVKLYRSNYIGKGDYCVAVIDSAETAIVEIVDFADNIIYTNNENLRKIDCKEDGANYIAISVEPSGYEIGTVQLKRGDLLEVYRSENGNYIKMHLCAEKVSGTVDAINYSGKNQIIEISGLEYEFSEAFVGNYRDITLGMFGEFYFDSQGRIAYYVFSEKADGILYAYIYDATEDDKGFDNKYIVKLYNENGEHNVIEFAEKVKFDGSKISSKQAYERLLDSGSGKLKRQLVMYSLNKNGQISYLDSAASVENLCESEGTLWKVSDISSYKYSNSQHMFMPIYPIRASRTKVFVIPKETVDSPEEKNFAVMTFDGKIPFNVEINYNVGFYKNTPEDPYMDVVLYALDEVPSYQPYKSVLIADQIYKSYDRVSGDKYVTMDCYISNYKTNVTFDDEIILKTVDGTSLNIKADEIDNYVEQGDILNYSENAVGEIARLNIVYDYDDNVTSWGSGYSNYANSTSIYPGDGMILADVSDLYRNPTSSSSQAMITVGENGINKEYISVLPARFKAIVYDSSLKNNKFYIGGLDDIVTLKNTGGVECSKIFVQKTSMYYTTFIIYK